MSIQKLLEYKGILKASETEPKNIRIRSNLAYYCSVMQIMLPISLQFDIQNITEPYPTIIFLSSLLSSWCLETLETRESESNNIFETVSVFFIIIV